MANTGATSSTKSASKTAQGTSYEKFVQGLYQTLHDADGFEHVNVEHNKSVTGRSGCTHQIDVYWEFKIAGQSYMTAIECKAYSSAVSIGRVRDFYGVLADVPNLQGVFVSLLGFQSGAKQYASHYGINLKEIREPSDEDWDGRVENIHLRLIVIEPRITAIKPDVTQDYLNTLGPDEVVEMDFSGTTADSFVVDQAGIHVASLEEIRQKIPTNKEPESGLTATVPFPDCYYNSSTRGLVPINSVTVRYDVHVDVEQADLFGKAAAEAIMKDIKSNELTFFSREGGVRKVRS